MPTRNDVHSKPRKRWPTYLAIVLVLVIVVYPLSIGPATVAGMRLQFVFRSSAFEELFIAFYTPLIICAEATGTENEMNAYALWWRNITNTH